MEKETRYVMYPSLFYPWHAIEGITYSYLVPAYSLAMWPYRWDAQWQLLGVWVHRVTAHDQLWESVEV